MHFSAPWHWHQWAAFLCLLTRQVMSPAQRSAVGQERHRELWATGPRWPVEMLFCAHTSSAHAHSEGRGSFCKCSKTKKYSIAKYRPKLSNYHLISKHFACKQNVWRLSSLIEDVGHSLKLSHWEKGGGGIVHKAPLVYTEHCSVWVQALVCHMTISSPLIR